MTEGEAKRLHEEAPAMTKAEIRRMARFHFRTEWLSSVSKPFLVKAFRQLLERHIP